MTDQSAKPVAETGLEGLEAELKSVRERSSALLLRSRAFMAASGKRRDEGLIAKLRRQLGLG